ncbi:MAG TPA: peptidoglycan DD-metalloendopeptidase family protein [Hyphomonadaceae bacterium]|nr:peptidoglycan DD-metalloendopeptidase family protein [Hyphomonadaceae bacterium]
MMSPDAFQTWVKRNAMGIEVIPGVHKAVAGKLSEPEVREGQPVRAGGYGEDRSIYTQPLFAPDGEEPRTIHLGVDIFAPMRTEVFTPFTGKLHSFQINDHPGDYGPTIILEHPAGSGAVFYTLYGHLSRDSIKGRKPGEAFMAGERIGWLGQKSENGGWPPHLHFQVILDMQGKRGDYPGVCKRSEADKWLALCPDPRPLLGLTV